MMNQADTESSYFRCCF